MSDQTGASNPGGAAGGAERRAFARLSMTLAATLEAHAGPKRACVVKDFCPGGVFVEVEGTAGGKLVLDGMTFQRGDAFRLRFSVESNEVWREFSVDARLAKAVGSGIGLSFVEANSESILALNDVAQREQQARNERLAQRPARDPEQHRLAAGLLEAMAERTGAFLAGVAPRVVETAEELAFTRSLDAVTSVEQNEFLEAKHELGEVRGALVDAFSRRVVERVRRLPEGGAPTDDATLEMAGSGGLSLVDTGSFDEWVAIKNMVGQAEPAFTNQSASLDAQASFVAGGPVEHTENPLGISGIAFAFHDAMRKIVQSARAREVLVESFHNTVVPELKSLYKDFGKMFEDRGVRPKTAAGAQSSRRGPPRPATGGTPAPGGESTHTGVADPGQGSAQTATYEAGTYVQPGGAPPAPPGAYPTAAHQQPMGQAGAPAGAPLTAPAANWDTSAYAHPGGAPAGPMPPQVPPGAQRPESGSGAQIAPGMQSGATTVIPGNPYAFSYPTGAVPIPMGSAFGAAQNMLSFARNADGARRAAPAAAGAAGPGIHPLPAGHRPAARTALINALDAFQQETMLGETMDGTALPPAEAAPGGAQSFSATTFSQTGTISSARADGAGAGDIGNRLSQYLKEHGVELAGQDSDSVEVISRLIDAVVADPLVGGNVKHRVRRLAVPLLKLALEDESLFADAAHPARQVVNKVGALNLPSTREGGAEGPSLRDNVDPLIDRVARAESGAAQAFADVLPKLDALIDLQSRNFSNNVSAIVKTREEQASLAREMRAKDPTRAKRATRPVPAEWQRWLSRAKNLRPGDALRISEQGTGDPAVMRLAWKDSDDSAYQFVDGAGNRGASFSQQELAMHLRRGWAEHVEDAALPALDRGMFKILESMHSELSEEVAVDPVTGLTHRRVFETRLARALDDAGYGEGVVVGVMDLDGFAMLNEKVGKKAGDALLKQLGKVLAKQVRGDRCTTRLAADDFAFLTEGDSEEQVHKVAEQLRRAIEASSCVWKGKKIPLRVSIGLAASDETVSSGGTLVESAKSACEAAKRAGGNRIVSKSESPAPAEPEKAAAASLDESRLLLRQQEIRPLDKNGKNKSHTEILLGIRQDDGTVGNPKEVVLAAERADEARELDRWVIKNSLGWMSRNRGKVAKSGGYSINLSGQTMGDDSLLQFVVDLLNETKVPPGKLIFEITESAAIDGLSQAAQFIRTMREYGCRFSIDDFGVGHAPFTYLRSLPVDYVKIDCMFIREIATNAKDYGLVKSMSDTAHMLGKQCIAECVESEDILNTIREIGLDYAQGFFISKPSMLE